MALVNEFVYDPVGGPFLRRRRPGLGEGGGGYPGECGSPCGGAASPELARAVGDVLGMALNPVGPLAAGSPYSLLPACLDADEEARPACWERVVTEYGVCFSASSGDAISGSTEDGSFFELLVDPGGRFGPGSGSADRYLPRHRLLLTPPRHRSRGALFQESAVSAGLSDFGVRGRVIWAEMDIRYLSKTTPALLAMDPASRRCLRPEERGLAGGKGYTQPDCVLECAWSAAAGDCGCVPWFLRASFPRSPACGRGGNRCFKAVVDGRHDNAECSLGCLPDCESIDYEVKFKTLW